MDFRKRIPDYATPIGVAVVYSASRFNDTSSVCHLSLTSAYNIWLCLRMAILFQLRNELIFKIPCTLAPEMHFASLISLEF